MLLLRVCGLVELVVVPLYLFFVSCEQMHKTSEDDEQPSLFSSFYPPRRRAAEEHLERVWRPNPRHQHNARPRIGPRLDRHR